MQQNQQEEIDEFFNDENPYIGPGPGDDPKTQDQQDNQTTYTKTVHDFTEPQNRKHFSSTEAAAEYANSLLRQGHQVKIYDYQTRRGKRKYVDILAEQGPPPDYRPGT